MLGIQPSEFWNMTPREGYIAMKTKKKLIENDAKFQYELVRFNLVPLINIQLPEEKQYRTLRDYVTFPWEGEEIERKIDEMTEDRWLELDKKYENHNENPITQ